MITATHAPQPPDTPAQVRPLAPVQLPRARGRLTRTAVVVGPFALAACTGPSEPPADPLLDDIRAQIEAAQPDPRARWDTVEELTAACMAEQGFEYQPDAYGQPDAWRLADPGDLEPGTREYAEQYGYGILTLQRWAPPENEPPDPNIERLLEMSPGELPLYTAALWGDFTEDPDVAELGLEYLSVTGPSLDADADVGCHGEAEQAVDAEKAGMDPEDFASLSAEMAALDEDLPDDPRLDGVNARWATCMLDAGYADLERVGDGEDVVLRAFDDRFGSDIDWGEPADGVDRQVHQLQLEMQPFEIEVAVADVQCREEVGYPAAFAELKTERQAEFVTEHRAELDAWLAAIAEEPPD